MFNTKNNALKKTKKKYINLLKNKDLSSYLIHERIANSLNRSTASANLDTTASRTNITRSQVNSYYKLPVNENENNSYKIKKCSYTDFLALRNNKITAPFNYTNERFKWQNLKDEHALIDPVLNTRPHRKQFLLKETFGDGMLGFINRQELPDNKPKIRRYRRYNTDYQTNIQNVDIEISRRVINPECNKEPPIYKKHKRSLSQTNEFYHRTTGEISSLIGLTPVNFELKNNKRLYKNKSYGAPSINIFSNNYGELEKPTHTKKLFIENNCYFDNIKNENLVFKMDNCWKNEKKKRNRSFDERCLTKKDYSLKYDCNTLNLRNIKYEYSLNNWNNRSVGRIKRK